MSSASRHLRRLSSAAYLRTRKLLEYPFLREPSFAIVGTGRSGTYFIASVLNDVGIRCGHEEWWAPIDRRRPFLVGDASWCATFELDDYEGRIFHQIRDPLRTLHSVAEVEVSKERTAGSWYRYRTRYVEMTGDPMIDSLRVVDTWLTRSEAIAEWTWRLEDVDPNLVVEIGRRLNRAVRAADAAIAIERAPRNEKAAKKTTTYDFGWADLPDIPEKERVLALAALYGYDTTA